MRAPAPSRLAVVAVALVLVGPRAASADDCCERPLARNTHTWWLPIGGYAGVGEYADTGATAGVVGGEISLVHYAPHDVPEISGRLGDTIRTPWIGGFVDVGAAFEDKQATRTRLTIGPEIGYGVIGVDGGLELELGGDHPLVGASLRAIFAPPGVILYGALVELPGTGWAPWLEFGLMEKIPIPLD